MNWIRNQSWKWVCWGRAEKQISPNVSFFKNREKFKTCINHFFSSSVNGPEILEENPSPRRKVVFFKI